MSTSRHLLPLASFCVYSVNHFDPCLIIRIVRIEQPRIMLGVLLDDLESKIDDIERNPSSLRQMHLDPDDFVDLRQMHTALVKYWSEDQG